MVGAPQSLDMVFQVGPDSPVVIGAQLAVGLSGAMATAVALLFAHYWRALLIVGAVGVLVGHLVRMPPLAELTVTVASAPTGSRAVPELAANLWWACLLFAAAGVLLIGLLCLAQRLVKVSQAAAGVAGLIGCAGYFGVSVIGPLRAADSLLRTVVVVVTVVVTVAAAANLRDQATGTRTGLNRARIIGAVLVPLSVTPTLVTAFAGASVFGTVSGGLAGIAVVLGVAVATASIDLGLLLIVAATSAVLTAAVPRLFLLHSSVVAEPWYAWPVALAGVLLGSAVAMSRFRLRLAAVIIVGSAVTMVAVTWDSVHVDRALGAVVLWSSLALAMAAVAATVGACAPTLARSALLPAFGALVTAMAVGLHGAVNLGWVGANGRPDPDLVFGATGQAIAAATLVGAGVLLLILAMFERGSGRHRGLLDRLDDDVVVG